MPVITELTDLSAPELDIFSRLTEAQIKHYFEPDGGLFIAESPMVIERAFEAGYEPYALLIEHRYITELADNILVHCENIPVYAAEANVMIELTGYHLTRGAICAMRRRELPSVRSVCEGATRIAVLENVMNPTNVGAIFRSAAALDFDAVLLTGSCSDPLYRRVSRVAMGTVFQVPWAYFDDDISEISQLHELGFATAAMALTDNSVGIDDPAVMSEKKLAVVLGTEGDGLAETTIAGCDYTVKIPMSHGVDSLNVAAASAVAFWQLGKRP